MSTQVCQANWYLGGPQVPLAICGSQHNGGRQLGIQGWLCEHMDPHIVPSDICLARDIYSIKWRNGDPPSGVDTTLDIIQVEPLMYSGARGCWRGCPLPKAPAPCTFERQLESLQHDHTEVSLPPGHRCLGYFPLYNYSHCPVNNFGPHHNQYLLSIGHGQYDQNHDVLIVKHLIPGKTTDWPQHIPSMGWQLWQYLPISVACLEGQPSGAIHSQKPWAHATDLWPWVN